MAVPKKKVSKARRDKRRSNNWKLSLPGMIKCPKCGKPRREGDCGCPTKEIDPRLAILATLFDKGDNNSD